MLYADELARLAEASADEPAAPRLAALAAGRAVVRAGRRRAGHRAQVRRPAGVSGAVHRLAGHQPRPDADRRAGHGQELPERAAGRGHQRRLDAHDPGERRHHRGQHQVLVELRPAGGRGAERAVAGPRAAVPGAEARAARAIRGDHPLPAGNPGRAALGAQRPGDDDPRAGGRATARCSPRRASTSSPRPTRATGASTR